MRKIGIMGGSFNPIHIGHLLLAECAREVCGLDEVWFVPTGCSYMKENCMGKGEPSSKERLEMVSIAVANNPYFSVSDIEVKREGNTYTYETMEAFRALYPAHEFYFIFGADCLYGIEHWKSPERIFASCKLIAAVREDFEVTQMQNQITHLSETYGADIQFLPFRQLQISSTEIRSLVRAGRSIRYLVPETILGYIEEKGLYRA